MKIVMFGHKRVPSREGGVEIVVGELSRRMAALGHQVTCCNRGGHHVSGAQYDEKRLSVFEGVKLRTVPTVDAKGLAAVTSSFFAALYAAFGRADAVHIHAEGPAFMCWLPALLGKRVVVTVHGLDWQREKWRGGFGSVYIRAGERMAVRYADEIIVLSRNVQQYFADTYGRKTVYIPNGVSRPPAMPLGRMAERFGLSEDGYFLFLGRLVPEKGVHYLIEAFRQVHTDKKLVIAGGASEAGDYPQQLTEAAGTDDRIVFTGFVQGDDLHGLYSNAFACVHPSDVEGMPLGLLEAMSYGNCCIVSDIPECTEVVEDRALVFPRADVRALRNLLQAVCDDPAPVQICREASSEFICRKYNWDEVTSRTLELYR